MSAVEGELQPPTASSRTRKEESTPLGRSDVLVSGCLAFDTTVFVDVGIAPQVSENLPFKGIAFVASGIHDSFGGCAGNISYGLKLLGCNPSPVAVVGRDLGQYRIYLESQGIGVSRVIEDAELPTARSVAISDPHGIQITAFHPGAAAQSAQTGVGNLDGFRMAVIAPSTVAAMLRHTEEAAKATVPVLVNPGQLLASADAKSVRQLVNLADTFVANEEEARIICRLLELGTDEEVARLIPVYITTLGSRGSVIYRGSTVIQVPPGRDRAIVDSTGCGDAYVAGLVSGILADLDWYRSGCLASLLAATAGSVIGTQSYFVNLGELRLRYRSSFGCDLPASGFEPWPSNR